MVKVFLFYKYFKFPIFACFLKVHAYFVIRKKEKTGGHILRYV